ELLLRQGHTVFILSRSPKKQPDAIGWNPKTQEVDVAKLEGIDVCVNLAGENIAGKLWSKAQKRAIQESRINATKTLVEAFSRLQSPPHTFISASAIGYYGDRGDQILEESADRGTGFLADTCDLWEKEAKKAQALNIRTALCRFAIVLSPKGGALSKM